MPIILEDKSEAIERRRPIADLEVQSDVGVLQRQRRQMLVALGLVVLAILLLLMKNWQSLFPAASNSEPVKLEHSVWPVPQATPAKPASVQTSISAAKSKQKTPPRSESSTPTPEAPAAIVAERAVLPPLEVEVVAGRQRQMLRPGSNSVKLDMQSDSDPTPAETQVVTQATSVAPAANQVVNAGESVRLSPNTLQVVSRPVDPNYPLLAKQMKVQGSVVLQALIGKGGNIEDLHVLSGPAILSSAAMEAVKQWRFRPYYLSGQAVETQARITVNFTISTY